MGLYDNFALPSNGQYISTYAGRPIEETAALGEVIGENYKRGLQGVSAFNVMRDNIDVNSADSEFKDQVFDEVGKSLKEYGENGNYEDAQAAIIKASSDISGNKKLRKAMAASKSQAKFVEALDKRLASGNMDQWQYDNAMSKLGNYKGVANDDDISNYLRNPSAVVDFEKNMMDSAKSVRQTSSEGGLKWVPEIGKYKVVTTKSYNPEEIQASIEASLSDPQTQAYLSEMTEAYGSEYVDNLIAEKSKAIYDSMEATSQSSKYVAGNAPGGSGGGSGGYGPKGNMNVLPIAKVEGVDYIDLSKNLNVDLNKRDADSDPYIVNNMSFEERAKIAQENKEIFGSGWLGQVFMSMDNYLKDIPSDSDIEEYEKLSSAAQDYSNMSESQWEAMNPQERDNAVIDYVEGVGQRQQELHITSTDVSKEVNARLLPSVAKNWSSAQVGEHLAKDIQVNHASRVMYDLSSQEVVEAGKDEDLNKAFAGEKGYSFTIKGDADSRNNFALSSKNEALSNSYVMQVTTPDGSKDYLVSKDELFQIAESDAMKPYKKKMYREVDNQEFETEVSKVYNAFPAPSYTNTYENEELGISLTGKRSKYNENTISVSDLSYRGNPIPLEDIATSLGFDGVTYDASTGELSGLTDEMITQIIFAAGLSRS